MEYIRIARDDEGAEVTQAPLDAADVDHGLFIGMTTAVIIAGKEGISVKEA